jgi:hypothetical protein
MQGEDDGFATISATAYVQNRENEKPVGVYAIFDAKRNIQYVGYSRNMVLSVKVGNVGKQLMLQRNRHVGSN